MPYSAKVDRVTSAMVSVILIVRNGAAYIAQALESVYQSQLQPNEILVVDGGSTDDTPAIAAQFPLVRILRQNSQGIANAYNEGIEQARGEFLAFISHDDLWLPDKLYRQIAYLQAHPEVSCTLTMVEHFLEPGTSPPPGFRLELLERPYPGWIMETLVARRAAFDRVGGFDPIFPVGEDTDWFARARDAGVVPVVLPEVLVRKRVHGDNSSLKEPHINPLLLLALRRSIERKRTGEDGHE